MVDSISCLQRKLRTSMEPALLKGCVILICRALRIGLNKARCTTLVSGRGIHVTSGANCILIGHFVKCVNASSYKKIKESIISCYQLQCNTRFHRLALEMEPIITVLDPIRAKTLSLHPTNKVCLSIFSTAFRKISTIPKAIFCQSTVVGYDLTKLRLFIIQPIKTIQF